VHAMRLPLTAGRDDVYCTTRTEQHYEVQRMLQVHSAAKMACIDNYYGTN